MAGTTPPKYLWAIATTREKRFPRSLARSELMRCTSAASLKLESSPKLISRMRKNRNASRP